MAMTEGSTPMDLAAGGRGLDTQDNLLRTLSITQSDHTSRLTRPEDGQRNQTEAIGRVEAVPVLVHVAMRAQL